MNDPLPMRAAHNSRIQPHPYLSQALQNPFEFKFLSSFTNTHAQSSFHRLSELGWKNGWKKKVSSLSLMMMRMWALSFRFPFISSFHPFFPSAHNTFTSVCVYTYYTHIVNEYKRFHFNDFNYVYAGEWEWVRAWWREAIEKRGEWKKFNLSGWDWVNIRTQWVSSLCLTAWGFGDGDGWRFTMTLVA